MSEEQGVREMAEEGVRRRRLLKALAAAGAATAATAVIPGTWQKPLAHVGVLPAHAQTSNAPPVLSGLNVFAVGASEIRACFGYDDPLDGVTEGSILTAVFGGTGAAKARPVSCDPVPPPGKSLAQLGASWQGDASTGSICFEFTPSCSVASFELCVTLEAQGRKSDPVCGQFNPI